MRNCFFYDIACRSLKGCNRLTEETHTPVYSIAYPTYSRSPPACCLTAWGYPRLILKQRRQPIRKSPQPINQQAPEHTNISDLDIAPVGRLLAEQHIKNEANLLSRKASTGTWKKGVLTICTAQGASQVKVQKNKRKRVPQTIHAHAKKCPLRGHAMPCRTQRQSSGKRKGKRAVPPLKLIQQLD
jgi:hypothetical protein